MKVLLQQVDQPVQMDDPSEYRPEMEFVPGKEKDNFRVYVDLNEAIVETYTDMHRHQTVEFVTEKQQKWGKLEHAEMTAMEAIFMLDNLVDSSDPDTDLPNSVHAFQTAERIREAHPDKEWLQVAGLIHDMGKVMALWGEPQWAVVGDTFPVGCKYSDKCVFYDKFDANPDNSDPRYNTRLGMYSENCGLQDVMMSWGHDEYLYRVLCGNKHSLPEEALYIIRYHSFYPWHYGGAYDYLCSEKDREMLKWVKEFNPFDLYSKADEPPDPEKLKDYYQSLLDKYLPGVLRW